MMLRFWLCVALVSCAVLVVRAQEEDEEAVHKREAELQARGGYQAESWNNGLNNGNDEEEEKGGKGEGKGDNEEEESGRGSGAGEGGRGSGASQEEIAQLIGKGKRNEYINKGTRFLGTKRSFSQSSNVVKSRKDNYYKKNFVNEVVSDLKLLRKKVNVHKHITIKKPLTVDHIKVHQQTNYVENIYPKLDKLYIKESGVVIQPSRLITIQRSANADKRVVNHRLQVNSASRRVNLGVRVEQTRNLGVRNLGGAGLDEDNEGGRGNGNGRGEGNGKGRGGNGGKGGSNNAYGW